MVSWFREIKRVAVIVSSVAILFSGEGDVRFSGRENNPNSRWKGIGLRRKSGSEKQFSKS